MHEPDHMPYIRLAFVQFLEISEFTELIVWFLSYKNLHQDMFLEQPSGCNTADTLLLGGDDPLYNKSTD